MTKEFNNAKTGIFWNIEDCPIPEGLNPRNILRISKHLLRRRAIMVRFQSGLIVVRLASFVNCGQTIIMPISFYEAQGNGIAQLNQMIVDILSFGMRNPAPSNVLVISKEVSGEFFDLLQKLKSENYNILVVQPDEIESEALLDIISMDWRWPKQSDIDKESDEVMSDSEVVA